MQKLLEVLYVRKVKKQIQRLTKDEEIVVTTYEGMHTHPLQKTSADSFEQIFRQIDINVCSSLK